MTFTVIEGGRQNSRAPEQATDAHAVKQAVAAEAERRLRVAGYLQSHIRHLATGVPIPTSLLYLKMQILYVAATLEQLDPVPSDFADDKFWPSIQSS